MSKTNVKKAPVHTHEGAKAYIVGPDRMLKRSVMACMLWEDEFYEDGKEITARIRELVPHVAPDLVAEYAIEAREKMKLRHVPLFLVREMARAQSHRYLVGKTLESVIQRADELAEFLAIYWKEGQKPIAKQVKTGLAKAFTKFSPYQLAKYNRDGVVKLKDVLFMVHPKPNNELQGAAWKQLVDGTLAPPDTWEVELSAGKDKAETFTRLIKEKKLGAMALLRNLRNMQQAKVNEDVIIGALNVMDVERVLPFRFITAARYAPNLEEHLETAMFKCLENVEKLPGKTVILVDVSGSMDAVLSTKSEATRVDVAAGLAILLREICDKVEIATFSSGTVGIPPRRGFALRDAIHTSQEHGGTDTGLAVRTMNAKIAYDRLIVITDEQSHTSVPAPKGRGYVVNVASARNGIGYGPWTHIDGWSEAVVDYIREYEKQPNDLK